MPRSGYALEYRTVKMFKKYGWFAIRTPRSKPFDILAATSKAVFIIECKNTTDPERGTIYVSSDQIEDLCKLAERLGWHPFLVFSFYRKRPRIMSLSGVECKGSLRISPDMGKGLNNWLDHHQTIEE